MADTLVSRTRICLQPFPQHSKAGPTQSYMLVLRSSLLLRRTNGLNTLDSILWEVKQLTDMASVAEHAL